MKQRLPTEEQPNLNFESPEQKRKRLIESIRRKRETRVQFTAEESDFLDQERDENRNNDQYRYGN
jgi:hypothetical protein